MWLRPHPGLLTPCSFSQALCCCPSIWVLNRAQQRGLCVSWCSAGCGFWRMGKHDLASFPARLLAGLQGYQGPKRAGGALLYACRFNREAGCSFHGMEGLQTPNTVLTRSRRSHSAGRRTVRTGSRRPLPGNGD